jgi:hypothetical protein
VGVLLVGLQPRASDAGRVVKRVAAEFDGDSDLPPVLLLNAQDTYWCN